MEPHTGVSVLDQLVDHAADALPDQPQLAQAIRLYYAHVDEADLRARRIEDLFGAAVDILQLIEATDPGTVTIDVVNPRVEVDGWSNEQTIVRIVSDDMPFLVDSVTNELSRLGVGIHLVVHPVVGCRVTPDGGYCAAGEATGGDRLVSLMSIEVDRQGTEAERRTIEENLRRVLDDVRAAVRDWQPMRERMREVAQSLDAAALPIDEAQVTETRELLEWLVDDHFLFIGARDYQLLDGEGGAGDDGAADGADSTDPDKGRIVIVKGSGLGVLAGDGHLGRPRLLSELPPAGRQRVREQRLLNLTKANSRSTIHRSSYLDYVGIKTFGPDGRVTGERRFLGLFSSEVYNRSVFIVPRARRTAAEVLARSDFPAKGHDQKRLEIILERYPRDDLLQMDADELFPVAMAIAGLQERRRVRVFARRELFGRFVTVLVYLPRDRYNTSTRVAIEGVLAEAYRGTLAEWDAQMSESVLARLRFVLQTEGDDDLVDPAQLEPMIQSLVQVWVDELRGAIASHFGQETAVKLGHAFGDAFPVEYQRAFDPRTGASDIEFLDSLTDAADLRVSAYRVPGRPTSAFKLKLYRRGSPVSLTAVMPLLTNLGVTVLDERPYQVTPTDRDPLWIYDFTLEHTGSQLDFATAAELVEDAVATVWSAAVEDDPLNQLVLKAGLTVGQIAVLRAYTRYLQQIRFGHSTAFVEQALTEHPGVVILLVQLFEARFRVGEDGQAGPAGEVGGADTTEIEAKLLAAIDHIESLDQDRVLRRFHNLTMSTVRTTWAQRGPDGGPLPYLALKFDSRLVDELPEPRPQFEVFVYSPRFEGVHLRAGLVARGGIRWSDRSEDYRTEILGLVKAQMVKNSVIVPVGAKGGFVLKQRPDDPADLPDEVVACYELFISALLDVTDNLAEGRLAPPPRTRRYDGDDPYLVVAADKGTARFSDVANRLAIERGFWLGDAFASGGSNGYDHKGMGITARGAWESVKRHFRELGVDVQAEPFTVVGIGDMSGDVFGNGMLRSPFIRLVAAFDHRHIFIDPDPDPEASYRERLRLFALPRSSWDDYDRSLLSAGGDIYDRNTKSITLSAQARAVLDVDTATVTPNQLISACLRAPVDLLWNGGIGTYVKGRHESEAEVGDKANDAIRINGADLRCAVVGEGGNLGVTQRGRVEFARNGGRIFTDAIDNAAGVDCSDHEVNIKILIDGVVADGEMTEKHRNELLVEMTDEVARLVLTDNYRQALALSTARIDAPSLVDVHARYIDDLEQQGLLTRGLEALPDGEELAERRLVGGGLTSPELAVLKAYSKNTLSDHLLASAIPDDPALLPLLIDYFPSPLRQRFADRIAQHRLRREIIANRLANLVVDRAGTTMVYRLGQETSAPPPEIAAAHYSAWSIFDLARVTGDTNALDGVLSVDKQLAIHLRCRQLAERATRLLLRNRPTPFDAGAAIAELAEPVAETMDGLADDLLGTDRQTFEADVAELTAGGAPTDLAERAALLPAAVTALDIVSVAAETGAELRDAAATYFAVSDDLELTWLRDRILALPRDTQWSTLARLTLRTDLYTDHRQLTALVIAGGGRQADPRARVERWIQQHRADVDRYRRMMVAIRPTTTDVTSLLVAAREVRNLINRTSASPV